MTEDQVHEPDWLDFALAAVALAGCGWLAWRAEQTLWRIVWVSLAGLCVGYMHGMFKRMRETRAGK